MPVYYPHGVEYRCRPGYSTNGASSGPTKITARVNSLGGFTPALPSECKLIAFTIRGRVKNARNGMMLSGVKVSVKDTDNSATSSWGFFTLRDIPAGELTLVYSHDDYINVERKVTITSNVNSGGIADISMSPSMQTDQWRIVVEWGRRPSDLDTYVKWGWSKVYYGSTRTHASGVTGTLEQDRTSGYGPETAYLSGVGNCPSYYGSYFCHVKYMVNDYTESGQMLEKGAKVTVYNGDHVAGEYKIGDCPGSVSTDGNWWHVVTIDASSNTLVWGCDQGPEQGGSGGLDLHAIEAGHNSTQHAPPAVKKEKHQLRIKRSASK